MSSEDHELLRDIAKKLDVLIGLAAVSGRDVEAQINILTSFGYSPAFIGPIVGLKPNAVAVRLSRRNKTAGRRVRKKGSD